eukprot:3729163-Rhodomonas_salina.1
MRRSVVKARKLNKDQAALIHSLQTQLDDSERLNYSLKSQLTSQKNLFDTWKGEIADNVKKLQRERDDLVRQLDEAEQALSGGVVSSPPILVVPRSNLRLTSMHEQIRTKRVIAEQPQRLGAAPPPPGTAGTTEEVKSALDRALKLCEAEAKARKVAEMDSKLQMAQIQELQHLVAQLKQGGSPGWCCTILNATQRGHGCDSSPSTDKGGDGEVVGDGDGDDGDDGGGGGKPLNPATALEKSGSSGDRALDDAVHEAAEMERMLAEANKKYDQLANDMVHVLALTEAEAKARKVAEMDCQVEASKREAGKRQADKDRFELDGTRSALADAKAELR